MIGVRQVRPECLVAAPDQRLLAPKENSLQFEVNNQPYFLNFISERGRWILLKATRSGIEAVPVVNDDEPLPLTDDEVEVESDEVVN